MGVWVGWEGGVKMTSAHVRSGAVTNRKQKLPLSDFPWSGRAYRMKYDNAVPSNPAGPAYSAGACTVLHVPAADAPLCFCHNRTVQHGPGRARL